MDDNGPMTKKELKALRKLERQQSDGSDSGSGSSKMIIFALGAIIFLAFFGFIIFSIKKNKDKPIVLSSAGYSRGNPAAKVTLVEFGDLQCPACRAYEPFVRNALHDYDGKVKLLYKNFPLLTVHPNANLAAKVAVAAGEQGKFFLMHDWLYDNQDSWAELSANDARAKMIEAAKVMGISTDKLQIDIDSKATTDKISVTENEGGVVGVSGTPTFYLNNERMDPMPQNYDEFKKDVAAAIAKAK